MFFFRRKKKSDFHPPSRETSGGSLRFCCSEVLSSFMVKMRKICSRGMSLVTHGRPWVTPAGFHILIIDDDKDFLTSMSVWFMSQGYSVEAVTAGEEALKILKKKKPNIIFLDFFMPGMDGLQTLGYIKKMKLKIPLVMLSEDAPEDICLKAYALGVNAIMDKSLDFYNAQHLINSLARVVSRQRS